MPDMRQVHEWFLHRGLPLVLTRRVRRRALIERSAPVCGLQLGALGTLMSRALPLLMLTVVVDFTGELWQLAARMSRERLWQTIGFLAIVAILFVVTTIRDEVRALREDRAEQNDPAKLLEGTPLAVPAGTPPERTPLSAAEQVNVVAVMVVSGHPGGVLHRRAVRVLPGAALTT